MRISLSALALLALACSQTDSDGVLTTAIYADVTARAADGVTRVSATLRVGGATSLTFVELVGDDHLEAESLAEGQVRRMSEAELLGVATYSVEFDGGVEGDSFRVGLVRTIDQGAPATTMELPAAFVLVGAPGPSSRAAAFQLAFEPEEPGDPIEWELEGPCITSASGTLPANTDAIQLDAGEIVALAGQEGATCAVELELTRRRVGTLDPGYDGGAAAGEQSVVVTFDSTP